MFNRGKGQVGRVIAGAMLGLLLAAGAAASAFAADGDLDGTFGGGGKATINFLGSADNGNGVAVQSDSKVILVGGAEQSTSTDFGIVRLNANGTLDTSFDGDGKVNTNFNGVDYDEAFGVALASGGKIVVVGKSGQDLAIARYNSDGSLDTSFSGDGKLTSDFGNSEVARDVVIGGDGKIVIAGSSGFNFLVARYNSNGTLDDTFSNDGWLTSNFVGSGGAGYSVALYGSRILVAGDGTSGGNSVFAVMRFNSAGVLDGGFSDDGKALANFGGSGAAGRDMAVQLNGKVVVAGQATTSGGDIRFAAARFNLDGTLDSSFGIFGITTASFAGGSDLGASVVIEEGGKIVVGGQSYVNLAEDNNFALVRFNGNGTLDTGFSNDGKLTTAFNGSSADGIHGLATAPNGKLVAVGFTNPNTDPGVANFAVARYNSCNPTFSDVNSVDFFYGPVRYLACGGIISGYGDNTFRPFANTTRSQLAKIVVGAQGWAIDTTGGPHFSDVPTSNAFYGAVETAYNHGIIAGYNIPSRCAPLAAPCFEPFANVTRGQLSKIVVSAQGWTLLDPGNPTFIDVPSNNAFYEFIETAVAKGIISGYQVGATKEFRPGNNATRGQISKIVYLAITAPDIDLVAANSETSAPSKDAPASK